MRWLAVLVLAVGCATTPSDPELQAERDRLANEVVQAKFWLDEYRKRYGERAGARLEMPPAAKDETLAAEVERLREEIRMLELCLDQYRRPDCGHIGLKSTTGVVIDIMAQRDEVRISIGRSDGVQKGDSFHVRRGAIWVGTIRIETASVHAAVGVFDTRYPGPGAPPRSGDVAYPAGR